MSFADSSLAPQAYLVVSQPHGSFLWLNGRCAPLVLLVLRDRTSIGLTPEFSGLYVISWTPVPSKHREYSAMPFL